MSDGDDAIDELLAKNKEWATRFNSENPGFLKELAKHQAPKALWFGCADSRVPESVITTSFPGVLFVQRNIANQIPLHDDNAQSVLGYAIEHLDVDHILVVGHTNCGGVKAAMDAAAKDPPTPPLNTPIERWLASLTALQRKEKFPEVVQLVEANVKAQVEGVAASEVVRDAWRKGKDVWVHGWVYDLETGLLRDLEVTVGRPKAKL